MSNIERVGKACSGCGACAQLCPVGCISMQPDAEGFLAPRVDAGRCTNCGLCLKRCPAAAVQTGRAPKATYAARLKEQETLRQSSSGGCFTAAARAALAEGGLVFGAALRLDDWRAAFVQAETEAGCAPMRGSKYVQSDVNDAYRQVDEALKAGRRVLFTGCPCQVAGLKAFLGRDDPNLWLCDIVCHGVPSPELFQTYVKALESEAGASLSEYRFRTKERGWGMRCAYRLGRRTVERRTLFDPYGHCFMKGQTYRESCYQCPYATLERLSDLTLCDYWGIIREHPSFYTEQGVSAVLVNTEKGEALFEKMKNDLLWIPSEAQRVSRHNANLAHPTPRPAIRDSIYEGMRELPPQEYVHTKLRVHVGAGEWIKAMLPWRVKRLYQRIAGGD